MDDGPAVVSSDDEAKSRMAFEAKGDGVKEPSIALILNIGDREVGRKRKEALADRAVSVGFRSMTHDTVMFITGFSLANGFLGVAEWISKALRGRILKRLDPTRNGDRLLRHLRQLRPVRLNGLLVLHPAVVTTKEARQ